MLPSGGSPHAAEGLMSDFQPGSHVVHAKLPALGSGEVLSSEKGIIRIRFGSGERQFVLALVAAHLATTSEAPEPPAKAAPKRARKKA
jgi:hypothetical protein